MLGGADAKSRGRDGKERATEITVKLSTLNVEDRGSFGNDEPTARCQQQQQKKKELPAKATIDENVDRKLFLTD